MKQDNKILTICPSRGRPEIAKRMYDSFKSTSNNSLLIFYLDNDDPKLDEYKALLSPLDYLIQERKTTTQIFNDAFKQNPDYEFYHLTNDDCYYITLGWDERVFLLSRDYGEGIFYGNDTMNGQNLCVTPIVSGNIVRALGWLQQPTLTHLYGDRVWFEIGKALNILYYMPDVIIEHRHWNNRKAIMDEGYMRVNSQEMFKVDDAAFKKWIGTEKQTDIERIKNGINKS